MTADEFTGAAVAVLGTALGWQTKIAERLDVDRRQVARWLQAGETPAWVDTAMADLMGARELAPWPRDEWVIGDAATEDGRRREYIVHVAPPRFCARIVFVDVNEAPRAEERPADVISGTVYRLGDESVLCEVAWFDEPPAGAITALMEAASSAIDIMSARAEAALTPR